MKGVGDTRALTSRQCVGLGIVHVLAWLQELVYRWVIGGKVWRSADGRVILISQMEDSHLLNSIRMLERRGSQPERLRELYAELETRPWGRARKAWPKWVAEQIPRRVPWGES